MAGGCSLHANVNAGDEGSPSYLHSNLTNAGYALSFKRVKELCELGLPAVFGFFG